MLDDTLAAGPSQFPRSRKVGRTRAPLPMLALALGMLVSFVPVILPNQADSSVSYLGWMLPLIASGFYWLTHSNFRFPLALWLPWIIYAGVYAIRAQADHAFQRSVMLLTPLVVGVAFSAVRFNFTTIALCHAWMNRFLYVFMSAALVSTGLTRGVLEDVTGFASGAITASLLASWYAVHYVLYRDRRSLVIWCLLATVPVLALTRTGIVAVALTLPLTLAPWRGIKRLLTIILLVIAGLGVFLSPRVQSKMFFSGGGSIEDALAGASSMLSGDSAQDLDFRTTGRLAMSQYMVPRLQESYWFGHGSNTTEQISMEIAGVSHPHNDWLRLRYEYGFIGALIFTLAVIAQVSFGLRRARRLERSQAIFMYAGCTAFIPMGLFMLSDNVLMYAAWFGNLQFAMLGLGYARIRAPRNDDSNPDAIS